MLTKQQKLHSISALNRAAATLGSKRALAVAVGVSHVAVLKWLTGASIITIENAVKIEHVTKGVVTASEIRPDCSGFLNK